MSIQEPEIDSRIEALLARYGQTFSEELGIELKSDTPATLFRWLIASLLLSARINSRIALRAARALADKGWTTPQRMAESTWDERTATLNRSGYARYDESTSRMLGDTVHLLIERYGGDLGRLREAAGCDAARERALLREFKGIGDVGVDIFFREVQLAWDEIYPFADRRALGAASRLGLGDTADALAKHVPRDDFPRLIAALVRVDLNKDNARVLETPSQRSP
jgi:hypothetical protein